MASAQVLGRKTVVITGDADVRSKVLGGLLGMEGPLFSTEDANQRKFGIHLTKRDAPVDATEMVVQFVQTSRKAGYPSSPRTYIVRSTESLKDMLVGVIAAEKAGVQMVILRSNGIRIAPENAILDVNVVSESTQSHCEIELFAVDGRPDKACRYTQFMYSATPTGRFMRTVTCPEPIEAHCHYIEHLVVPEREAVDRPRANPRSVFLAGR